MINTPLSPYKKRKVSSFLAHEMLFDYLMDRLDSERRTAVENELKTDIENQKALAEMKKALNYIEKINRVEIEQDFLEGMSESSNYISIMLKKTQFDKWPSSVKWSIEALIVVLGVVLFLVVVPWDQALKMTLLPKEKEVILAEITKDPGTKSNINLAEIEKKEVPQFQDEEKKSTTDVAEEKPPSKVTIATTATNETTEATAPTQDGTAKVGAPIEQANSNARTSTTKESSSSVAATAEDAEKKSAGFLYRGHLEITNVEMNSPKITEKIIELGGRKAGEVDIGWKKSDTTYYYHFTLPEAKYNDLIEFFSEYTETELKKEKHPRVMPDGIIRLIITVDEKKQ